MLCRYYTCLGIVASSCPESAQVQQDRLPAESQQFTHRFRAHSSSACYLPVSSHEHFLKDMLAVTCAVENVEGRREAE